MKDTAYYEGLDKRTKEYKDWIKGQDKFNKIKDNLVDVITDVVNQPERKALEKPKNLITEIREEVAEKVAEKIDDEIQNKPPKKLGDAVEKAIPKVVKKVVKKLFGDDCGCDERKEKLNKIHLPQRYAVRRCLTEDQYNQYDEYRKRRTLDYKSSDVRIMIDLFAHVFAIQYNQADLCLGCNGAYKTIKKIEDKLDIVFESYESN